MRSDDSTSSVAAPSSRQERNGRDDSRRHSHRDRDFSFSRSPSRVRYKRNVRDRSWDSGSDPGSPRDGRRNKRRRKEDQETNRDHRDPRRGSRRRRRRRRRRGRESSRHRDTDSIVEENRRGGVEALASEKTTTGIVSDDEDYANVGGVEPKSRTKASPGVVANKVRSPSSHDDLVGHFQGGPGTVIADRYRFLREVGMGTFGRVVDCLDLSSQRHRRGSGQKDAYVAIKIVRNVKRYCESAKIEANIVGQINRRGGRGRSHCVVLHDAFNYKGHFCLVFESLGPSLYDFMKRHDYRPFPMICIQDFTVQLLEAIEFLHSFGLVHTDLKIENILLISSREITYRRQRVPESTRIKLIDFGGACYDDSKKSSVINTRQYRAPEVILEAGWSMPSDMWSLGCILAELYKGELLFATHENIEHLALIERVLGPFPRRLLSRATKFVDEAFDSDGWHRMGRILSGESLSFVRNSPTLQSIIRNPDDDWLLRLLSEVLRIEPEQRWTAHECLRFLSRIKRDVVCCA